MDNRSFTFSFRQLPWAGLTALALVLGVEHFVFSNLDLWRAADERLATYSPKLVHMEVGVVGDVLGMEHLNAGPEKDQRIIVFGNSRAMDGVIFKSDELGHRVARVTHGSLSPFFARTFAEEVAASRADIFVYPLGQYETHKPVRVRAKSSFGSFGGFLDVVSILGLQGVWKKRVDVERLAVATLFDSYRYRDVLDRCWLNALKKLNRESRMEAKAASERVPRQTASRHKPTAVGSTSDGKPQFAEAGEGASKRQASRKGGGRAARNVWLGSNEDEAKPIVSPLHKIRLNRKRRGTTQQRASEEKPGAQKALTSASKTNEKSRIAFSVPSESQVQRTMPKLQGLDEYLASLPTYIPRDGLRPNIINAIHEVRRGAHVDQQEQLLASMIDIMRAGGCEVLFVETPLNPLAAALYDEKQTREEFRSLAKRLVSEHGAHFLSSDMTGPFPEGQFTDLLHLNKSRGKYLGKAVLMRIEQILGEN